WDGWPGGRPGGTVARSAITPACGGGSSGGSGGGRRSVGEIERAECQTIDTRLATFCHPTFGASSALSRGVTSTPPLTNFFTHLPPAGAPDHPPASELSLGRVAPPREANAKPSRRVVPVISGGASNFRLFGSYSLTREDGQD